MERFQDVLDTESIQFKRNIIRQAVQILIQSKLTVAVAESVMLGTLLKIMTRMPKREVVFRGGFSCVGTQSLISLGKVAPRDIQDHEFSKIALSLAKEVKTQCGANIGLATAGVITEVSPGEYSGKISFGYVFPAFESVKTIQVIASEAIVEERIIQTCFAYLRQYLQNHLAIPFEKEMRIERGPVMMQKAGPSVESRYQKEEVRHGS